MTFDLWQAALAVGLFPAVPVAGTLVVGRSPTPDGWLGRLPLLISAGLAVCSIPLMASLMLGVYSPGLLGGLGWLLVVAWLVLARPTVVIGRPSRGVVALVLGLAAVGVLYVSAPTDPLAGGRDMAVYANHAIYMAHHGQLDVPYPDGIDPDALPAGWVGFSGLYSTEPTLTVQFAHVFPAWLAQTFAAFGYGGMLRFNAVLALVTLVALFAFARRYVPEGIAVIAVLFLAFNPGQVWVVRNTLTEPMTQLFVATGLLLLASPNPSRPRAAAAWAGIAIGMTAVVRLDSLALLPLLILGHTVASVVARDAGFGGRTRAFYTAAMPIFVVALAYYVAYSWPYLEFHLPVVVPIGAATVVAALLYAVTQVSRVRVLADRALTSRWTIIGAAVTVLLLAAYAYVLRPRLGPFQLLPVDPPVPYRSHVEDAMRNLAAYVSPPVLLMAVVGWVIAMAVAIRRRLVVLLPILIAVGGFSAMYFWNQAITPDHFWAIRRFVPIIMPATILLAAYFAWTIASRLPMPWRPILIGLAVAALAVHTYRIGNPMYFVAERSGAYAAIEELASELPDDEIVFGPLNRTDLHTVGTALFMSFDKPVLAVSYEAEGGRDELLSRLRGVSATDPVRVIAPKHRLDWLEGEVVASVSREFELMAPTVYPVPQEVVHRSFDWALVEVTGINVLDSELGPATHWLVNETGFHNTEAAGTARWTDGEAVLNVPLPEGEVPDELFVDLAWTGPLGADLEIYYDGEQLFAGHVPSGPWERTFDVPRASEADEVQIRLESSTFVPAEVMEGSTDPRTLGVMVRGLRLISENP